MQKISIIVTFFCIVLVFSCTRDESVAEPPPCDSAFGYIPDIQPILETNCTYSGCHDGSGATKYDTYELLKPKLDDGMFSDRVITRKDMPPTYATGPKMLRDGELDTIRMWILAGAPEMPTEVDVTYENGIGDLLTTYCGYSGCHDADPGGEQAPRNYNFYNEILVHLNNGKFVDRVITRKSDAVLGMPPERGTVQFTPEEFDLIKCWIEKGYPEN